MKTNSLRALLVATTAAAFLALAPAYAADAPAPKVSAGVSKYLVTVQKALAAKDYAGAKAALDSASQVSGRTDYDNYLIGQFTMVAAYNTNDVATATIAAQTSADNPAVPDNEKQKVYTTATQLSLQAKQYDKGMVYAKKLQGLNPTDLPSLQTISQAYYFGKDFPSAVAVSQKVVDNMIAANKVPDRNSMDLLLSSQVEGKDEAGAEKTLEMMVAFYNNPDDWQQIIDVTLGTKGLRDLDAIWLGRLMFLSGATVSQNDSNLFGSTASHLTFFGDAQMAQQHGGTGFPDADANANKDKQTIAAQIAAGQKANGQYNVKLAEALYSYGMYAEAEAAARLAQEKGGATDASEAPMVLGQALVAQGKYDDAIASFGQVMGGGPATPRTVRLWVDYAKIKKNPPVASAK